MGRRGLVVRELVSSSWRRVIEDSAAWPDARAGQAAGASYFTLFVQPWLFRTLSAFVFCFLVALLCALSHFFT
jgi:hypothetical protein